MIPKHVREKVIADFNSVYSFRTKDTLTENISRIARKSGDNDFKFQNSLPISQSGYYEYDLEKSLEQISISTNQNSCIYLKLVQRKSTKSELAIRISAPLSYIIIELVCEDESQLSLYTYCDGVSYLDLNTIVQANSKFTSTHCEWSKQTIVSSYSTTLVNKNSKVETISYHLSPIKSQLYHEGIIIAKPQAQKCIAEERLIGVLGDSTSILFLEPVLDISSATCLSSHTCSLLHLTQEQEQYAKSRGINSLRDHMFMSSLDVFLGSIPDQLQVFKQEVLSLEKH